MKRRNSFFVAISLVLVLSIMLLSGCGSENNPDVLPETTVLSVTESTSETESVTSSDASTGADGEVTELAEQPVTAEAVPESATDAAAPQTVEEIVEYFNVSVNKIKPDAKTVVKNYEKRIVDEERLVVPASLDSTAKSMIKTFLKDDTEPIVYDTREEITSEFLVPGQSYVSMLKPEYVKSATCKDNGEQYIIHISLKDSRNAVPGEGVGSVCDVIEANEVAEKASFIEKFTTLYRGCEVTATIDKATGKTVHMRYVTPVELDITVNLFGTHDATAVLTFEKDYSITY